MRCILTIALLAVIPPLAQASPYWIEYDAASGNFPEEEGWTRYTSGGGDVRYFEDGALVLDGQSGWDSYAWFRPAGQLDPGPGEVFVAQWRVCVSGLVEPFSFDPAVIIDSDAQTDLLLVLGYDRMIASGDYITYAPGVFHDYELRSPDMLNYELYIDGALAFSGSAYVAAGEALVMWGDGELFAGSVSRWGRFGFGVVPEPCSGWAVLLASLWRFRPRATAGWAAGVGTDVGFKVTGGGEGHFTAKWYN